MCISGAGREGCVWIILDIRIGMVTHITLLLGMYVVKGLLEREWCIESFKEPCVLVSYALLQAESLGLYILLPIFVCACFQRKIKIWICHGGRCGHPQTLFVIVILRCLLQIREPIELFN